MHPSTPPTIRNPHAYLWAIARQLVRQHPRLTNDAEDLVQEGHIAMLRCRKPGFELSDAKWAMHRAACKHLLGVTQGKAPRDIWHPVSFSPSHHAVQHRPDLESRDTARRVWQILPVRVQAILMDPHAVPRELAWARRYLTRVWEACA